MLKPFGILTHTCDKGLHNRLQHCCDALGAELFVIGRDCELLDWDSQNKIYNLVHYSPFNTTLYLKPYAILNKLPKITQPLSILNKFHKVSGEDSDLVDYALAWVREPFGWNKFRLFQYLSEGSSQEFSDEKAIEMYLSFHPEDRATLPITFAEDVVVNRNKINGAFFEGIIYNPKGDIDVSRFI